MKNIKSNYKTCQRSDKPDELTMIALRNKNFAKRFVEEFKKARGEQS